jgi:hypothetical protein
MIPVGTVMRIQALLSGDSATEEAVAHYIKAHWNADSLRDLPAHVAREICLRPRDFLRAVRKWKDPELGL